MLKKMALFAAVVTLPLLPGYAQQQEEEDPIAAAKKTQTPQSVLRMANEIRKQIVTLPEFGVFDDISFQIKDYTVTLKGDASRPILKDSAERVTKKVEGVEKVINQIEVLPLSPNDDRIRARVYAAIYYHPTLSRYNPGRGVPVALSPASRYMGITNDPPFGNHSMKIIVKNGNVRLEGVVDNEMDKQIAGMQANGVSGVFSVDNDLNIAQSEKPKKEKKK